MLHSVVYFYISLNNPTRNRVLSFCPPGQSGIWYPGILYRYLHHCCAYVVSILLLVYKLQYVIRIVFFFTPFWIQLLEEVSQPSNFSYNVLCPPDKKILPLLLLFISLINII